MNQKHYQELPELPIIIPRNTIVNNKLDEQPNKLIPYICLFTLNSNAVVSMYLQQPQKAKIINELASLGLPNHLPIQAKKDLALLLAKLNIDTQLYEN